jgi:hypothetical protein
MTTSLEDLIEESARRIVYGGIYHDGRNGRYKVSFSSERRNLNAMVTTLLGNAVSRIQEEQS